MADSSYSSKFMSQGLLFIQTSKNKHYYIKVTKLNFYHVIILIWLLLKLYLGVDFIVLPLSHLNFLKLKLFKYIIKKVTRKHVGGKKEEEEKEK